MDIKVRHEFHVNARDKVRCVLSGISLSAHNNHTLADDNQLSSFEDEAVGGHLLCLRLVFGQCVRRWLRRLQLRRVLRRAAVRGGHPPHPQCDALRLLSRLRRLFEWVRDVLITHKTAVLKFDSLFCASKCNLKWIFFHHKVYFF